MKLEINKVAKLNNDEKYIILNELSYEGNYYYLTMGLINDKEFDSSKVVILKEASDTEGYSIEKVTDNILLYELTKKFKEQL